MMASLNEFPESYAVASKADDLAMFQYTSGTTRELPSAVKHSHRALVTLMFAALYGTGIRPGDEFFCPSSPAWGHGLWHGTLKAPLALGVTTGTFRRPVRSRAADEGAAGLSHHQHVGRLDPLSDDEERRQRGGLPLRDSQALLHRRADRRGDAHLHRSHFARPRLQHVRHHRDRRGVGQLSGRRGFRGTSRLARQADSGGEARSAGGRRRGGKTGDGRRAHAVAARRVAVDQGSRPNRRTWLFLPCRTGRRRHHLGRLDDERGRDREHLAQASPRP